MPQANTPPKAYAVAPRPSPPAPCSTLVNPAASSGGVSISASAAAWSRPTSSPCGAGMSCRRARQADEPGDAADVAAEGDVTGEMTSKLPSRSLSLSECGGSVVEAARAAYTRARDASSGSGGGGSGAMASSSISAWWAAWARLTRSRRGAQ